MIQEKLLKEISGTLTKHKVVKLVEIAANSIEYVPELLKLSFYPKPEIAFRASWILENISENEPVQFLRFFEDFMRVYHAQSNQSCRRHFTKILMNKRMAGELDKYPDDRVEPLVDATFQWLIDPVTPVAVKVNCIDILYRFNKRYDWIGEELKSQIEFLLKNGSAAMQSRGRKVLRKL